MFKNFKRNGKKLIIGFFILVLAGYVVSSTSIPAFAANSKHIILKFGHGSPPGQARDKGAHMFAQLVEKKTNGKIEVEVYPSASLGSDEEVLEQLQMGVTAFGAPGVGTIADLDPKLNVIEMPFLFDSWEQAWALLDGPVGKELIKDLPKKGIRVLAFWENGFRHITNSKRPIEKPSDLKGIKIRVPNWEMSIATFEALPSSVTPMAWPELFLALQQGVVDAQENPLTIVWGAKFYEVQKYLSLIGHQYSPLPLIISEKIWKKLSPEYRKAIQEAAYEARDYQRQLVVQNENTLLIKLLKKGMIANWPDKGPFKEVVEPVYRKYQKRYGVWIKKVQEANKEWKIEHEYEQ